MERRSTNKNKALSQKSVTTPPSSNQTSQQKNTQKQICIGQVGKIK